MHLAQHDPYSTFSVPHFTLRPRADTTTNTALPTGSNGCVECPSSNGACPQCPDGQECNLTAQTCNACPQYVCVKIASSKSISGPQIGGIVGGVVGGLAALALAAVFYYILIYRKKHPQKSDGHEMDGHESKYEMEDSSISQTDGGGGSSSGDPKNRRLSSYESFMRPPGYSKRGGGNRVARPRDANNNNNSNSREITANDAAKRYSVATTVSTTNASNILPIAYIPGVTIRPTKNNTRSIFSYDNESVFSDFTGLDAASIQERGDPQRGTATAVRAQPRLVNVARIDEDIAEEDEEMEGENGIHGAGIHIFPAGAGNGDGDGDSDSDVDSDIGEINRATSTRRHGAPSPRSVFADADSDNSSENNSDDGHITGQSKPEGFDSVGELHSHTLEFTLDEASEGLSDHDDDDDDDDDNDDEKSFVLDIARET